MHGYKLDFHDAHAHHENHTENHHASVESEAEPETLHASTGSEHADYHGPHHGPTFIWDVHLDHQETGENHVGHHESGADQLVSMVESGEISFADKGNRRFW